MLISEFESESQHWKCRMLTIALYELETMGIKPIILTCKVSVLSLNYIS